MAALGYRIRDLLARLLLGKTFLSRMDALIDARAKLDAQRDMCISFLMEKEKKRLLPEFYSKMVSEIEKGAA